MAARGIASRVRRISKTTTVAARIIDVVGTLCSVQLSERGQILSGLKYIGVKPIRGQLVSVDYSGENPVVNSTADTAVAEETITDLSNFIMAETVAEEPLEEVLEPLMPPAGEGGDAVATPKTYTWLIEDPLVNGHPGPRLNDAGTTIRVDGFISGGGTSVSLNIETRSVPNVPGDNILTSELVALPAGAFSVTFSNPGIAVGDWLWLDISAVSGTVGAVTVTLTVEN